MRRRGFSSDSSLVHRSGFSSSVFCCGSQDLCLFAFFCFGFGPSTPFFGLLGDNTADTVSAGFCFAGGVSFTGLWVVIKSDRIYNSRLWVGVAFPSLTINSPSPWPSWFFVVARVVGDGGLRCCLGCCLLPLWIAVCLVRCPSPLWFCVVVWGRLVVLFCWLLLAVVFVALRDCLVCVFCLFFTALCS